MMAIFLRKLRNNWLMILGWGVGLGLLGFYLFDIYENFFTQNIDLRELLSAFPEDIMAFFGGDVNLFEPSGFLHLEFFSYMPIILGIMVISNATSLISKKEEEGTLEIIIAQPVSRSLVFWSRLLALIVSVILILAIIWGGFALGLSTTETFDIGQTEMIRPLVSLFAILFPFLALALFLSMLLPSSSAASLVSGFLLIAFYFISSLARIDGDLESINRFSPFKYYQGGAAVNGLDLQNLLMLFGISIVFILLAWFFFVKRDLRFGGSGGLRLVFQTNEVEGD